MFERSLVDCGPARADRRLAGPNGNPNERMAFTTLHFRFLALAAAWMLAGSPAQGGNLLVNPNFEGNSGHVIPVGWTRFEPPTAQHFGVPPLGNFWVESNVPTHSPPS